MIIQYRDIAPIVSLVFRGPGSLIISQADHESLCIEASGEHLDQIESRVINGQLKLGLKTSRVVDFSAYQKTIRYHLTIKELNSIRVMGVCSVSIPDIDRDEFSIRLSGGAKVDARQLTADYLDVAMSDRSILEIGGDVERQFVVLSGEAQFLGEHLMSDAADIRLTDSAQGQIRANDQLDAYIGERSRLTYIGYPDLRKLGAGKVERRRRHTSIQRGKEHG